MIEKIASTAREQLLDALILALHLGLNVTVRRVFQSGMLGLEVVL